jgi:hypothetical protein
MPRQQASAVQNAIVATGAVLASAVLSTAILVLPAMAQVRGAGAAQGTFAVQPGFAGFAGSAGRPGVGVGSGIGRPGGNFGGGPGHVHRGRSGRSGVILPYPYYYSDFGSDSEEPGQPQIIVMPATAPVPPTPPAAPIEPLLIEWQGDHFERMTFSEKKSGTEPGKPESANADAGTVAPASTASNRAHRKVTAQRSEKGTGKTNELARDLPPAVLVFHDGRTEELKSYTIMSGTIYSKSDYWTTGSWTKKIQIADLDVPATLKLNHDHGLNFVLPAGPNEVVTRP